MKDTKELIIETAFEMFLSNNYEAVTFREICNVTKLTKGAVYHYFQSKEELFKAVVEKYIIEKKSDFPTEFSSLREMIDYSVEEIKIRNKNHGELSSNQFKTKTQQIMSLVIAAFRYYPGFESLGNKLLKNRINVWKKALETAITNKEIRGDIDIDTIAFLFFTTGANIVLGFISNSSQDALLKTKKQMEELYNLLKI